MLPREYKLKRDNDFKKIFKNGRYCQSEAIRIKFLKNDLGVSRFAFVVSLKVSKKAVVRNTLRRRMGEIIRLNISRIKPGFDIVAMANPEMSGKKYREIESDLISLLQKSRLLVKN